MELIRDYEKAGFFAETDYFSHKRQVNRAWRLKQKLFGMNYFFAFCFVQTVFGLLKIILTRKYH